MVRVRLQLCSCRGTAAQYVGTVSSTTYERAQLKSLTCVARLAAWTVAGETPRVGLMVQRHRALLLNAVLRLVGLRTFTPHQTTTHARCLMIPVVCTISSNT